MIDIVIPTFKRLETSRSTLCFNWLDPNRLSLYIPESLLENDDINIDDWQRVRNI